MTQNLIDLSNKLYEKLILFHENINELKLVYFTSESYNGFKSNEYATKFTLGGITDFDTIADDYESKEAVDFWVDTTKEIFNNKLTIFTKI